MIFCRLFVLVSNAPVSRRKNHLILAENLILPKQLFQDFGTGRPVQIPHGMGQLPAQLRGGEMNLKQSSAQELAMLGRLVTISTLVKPICWTKS